MKILVNQIGYGNSPDTRTTTCRAVVQAFETEERPEIFTLRDEDGNNMGDFHAEDEEVVRGWQNRHFRQLIFSAPERGPYTLEGFS